MSSSAAAPPPLQLHRQGWQNKHLRKIRQLSFLMIAVPVILFFETKKPMSTSVHYFATIAKRGGGTNRTKIRPWAVSSNSSSPTLTSPPKKRPWRPDWSAAPPNAIITPANILWSKNWRGLVRHCPTVPPSYYSAQTDRQYSPDELRQFFVNCTGTLWMRLGSAGGPDRGDVHTFIEHVLPHMGRPFRLVTTDGDRSVPRDVGNYRDLLRHPLCQAWYTQNYDADAAAEERGSNALANDALENEDIFDKLHHVPIGFDLHTTWFGIEMLGQNLDEQIRNMNAMRDHALRMQRGWNLSLSNADIANAATVDVDDGRGPRPFVSHLGQTHPERQNMTQTLKQCSNPNFIESMQHNVGVQQLWDMFSRRRFGISPRGNGLDCHRTWEMLFFGMIPIVKTGPLDALYQGLPVIVVNDWSDVCEEDFLRQEYAKTIPKLPIPNAAMTVDYWIPSDEEDDVSP